MRYCQPSLAFSFLCQYLAFLRDEKQTPLERFESFIFTFCQLFFAFMGLPPTPNSLIKLCNENRACIYVALYEHSKKFVYVEASIFICMSAFIRIIINYNPSNICARARLV